MKKAIWAKTCLALIIGVVITGVLLRGTISQATSSSISGSLITVYALLLSSSSSSAEEGPSDGYNLFTSLNSTTAYLMDNDGNFVHSWETEYSPGNSMYFSENGSLLHTGKIGNTTFTTGGAGGLVQIFDWDGSRTWQYQYSSQDHLQHHDVEILPNGNILMVAWQYKDETEALTAGRNPSLLTESELWPDSKYHRGAAYRHQHRPNRLGVARLGSFGTR